MTVSVSVLEDTQQDAETAAGDVFQLLAVYQDVAVRTLKDWCQIALCLRAGSIIEVANEGNHQTSVKFVNRDVHSLYVF